jgi:AraC-like DNA-binding protein
VFDHRLSALCAFVQFATLRGCCRKSTVLLELAKQLLGKEDQPLAHVALTLQFSCRASFTRAFREATGQTPTQYRGGVGVIAAEQAAKNDNG